MIKLIPGTRAYLLLVTANGAANIHAICPNPQSVPRQRPPTDAIQPKILGKILAEKKAPIIAIIGNKL